MIRKANIIDGKKISQSILDDLKTQIDQDKNLGFKSAKLAIILVGDNPASKIYVQNKIKAALSVGIETMLKQVDDLTEDELLEQIDCLNEDNSVSGMIIQLPLPSHIDKAKVMMRVSPNKDVDGFHPINPGLLFSSFRHDFVPCTARGCLTLIKSCVDDLRGKYVVIIGRSDIVGRPLAALLIKEDCTVTICHSKTKNLQDITMKADIIVSAVGVPRYLTKNYFNKNSIVIDVGINRIIQDDKNILTGDVDFDEVKNHVKFITPVPGGVGPMTVAYLLVNTYRASKKQQGRKYIDE